MSVGGWQPIKSLSGGGDGVLYNLKAKKPIPLTGPQKAALEAKGNELGNCCEQKMLRKVFFDGGAPFPPPGGVSRIKMGITNKIGGRPNLKEIRGAHPEKKCGTCEDVLKMMLCTDVQKKGG